MSPRRLLPILAFALLLAPFGRMAAAEAAAHPQMEMGSHCAGQPVPASDGEQRKIDCLMACAAMAAAVDPVTGPAAAAPAAPVAAAAAFQPGIRPEAEPPPPRIA